MADGVQSLTKLGTQEYFWNYYELDNGYIDINADYWDQSAIEALSIANHLYYITGEAIVSDNAATWAMYYNKDLLADNGLQNPVELVDARHLDHRRAVRDVQGGRHEGQHRGHDVL